MGRVLGSILAAERNYRAFSGFDGSGLVFWPGFADASAAHFIVRNAGRAKRGMVNFTRAMQPSSRLT
jgi:hypothetical protein